MPNRSPVGSESDLSRFLGAQQATYAAALEELRAGRKQSHWMWFVFPQIAGLGRSETAVYYGIADRAEALACLAHPVLGTRLIEATETVLQWGGQRTAEAIFGTVDAMKFHSSMTLFAEVAPPRAPFATALERFYAGAPDAATLARL